MTGEASLLGNSSLVIDGVAGAVLTAPVDDDRQVGGVRIAVGDRHLDRGLVAAVVDDHDGDRRAAPDRGGGDLEHDGAGRDQPSAVRSEARHDRLLGARWGEADLGHAVGVRSRSDDVEQGLGPAELDAIGVVETTTVAACIVSADVALKQADVELLELRIANGLGGKSYVTMTGEVSDVRSSVQAGAGSAETTGRLARHVVIAKPHPDLGEYL